MIYTLHFDRKFGHAQHYRGYTENWETLKRRLERHVSGRGSKLMRAVCKSGISWSLVQVIEDGTRSQERRLHLNGSGRKHCPLCLGDGYWDYARFTPKRGLSIRETSWWTAKGLK